MTIALEFTDFSFAYPGCPAVVGPVSWQVDEGSFTLLVGATGSGKTTLLRCAKPQIAPVGQRSGSVFVMGCLSDGLDVAESSQTVGYVAQSPDNQLVCDTVWHEMAFGLENMGLPQDEMRRRVAEVAHFFGIEPWFHKSVNDLSGGQKQLLNLASVLVMQPKILLLDEPTAQLDPVAQRNFCHALFRLNRELGLTIVVATHAPQTMAAYATECVELDRGQVVSRSLQDFKERALVVNTLVASLSSEVALELSNVYVRYGRQDDFVLQGASLCVAQSSVHALVGGNGSGKSTLLKVLAGVMKPARGRVKNTHAHNQAFLPQDPKALFVCDTVAEELMEWSSSCSYGMAECEEWLQRIGLDGLADNHPYDLSGGQQQLLAFAKLALTMPSLLLLDEPAKGLDASSKLLLAQCIIGLRQKGCTVIMATHDLAFAACVADEVSMLFDGQVTSTEKTAEFFQRNLFYRPVADGFTDAWVNLWGQ